MNKLAMVLIGSLLSLSLTGLALAQAKPEPAKEAVKPETAKEGAKPEAVKPEAKKEVAPPAPIVRRGGLVESVDPATGTLILNQDSVKEHRKLKLTVSKKEAQKLSGIKPGDLVNVWVRGKTVTQLAKVE